MKKFAWFLLLTLIYLGLPLEASAQNTLEFRRFEINADIPSYSRQGNVNRYGGTLGFTVYPAESIGIVSDIGIHQPTGDSQATKMTTYMFGPRISFRLDGQQFDKRRAAFGQLLVGGVRIDGQDGTVLANGFSMVATGGLDIGIRNWVALRVIEGGYSGLRLNGAWSNGMRISAGIVFRFGGDGNVRISDRTNGELRAASGAQ